MPMRAEKPACMGPAGACVPCLADHLAMLIATASMSYVPMRSEHHETPLFSPNEGNRGG